MSEVVAESAAVAENGEKANDSMEKLEIDDDEEKNVSAEDILGDEVLKMSDSEDDDSSEKITHQRRTQRMLDSDEEQEKSEPNAIGEIQRVSKKKVSALIDSDTEEEQDAPQPTPQIDVNTTPRKTFSDNEEERTGKVFSPKAKKKICSIIDTDSEEEAQQEQIQKKEKHSESSKQNKKSKKKDKKKKKQRLESDDEMRSLSSEEEEESKLKGIVDSESESEGTKNDEPMDQLESTEAAPGNKQRKTKPMRASAKKAMDDMQAIQSEQQRLHREAHISVPYHQPKPRTLKEFLSRRTINKPLAVALAGGSPMPSKKEPRRSLALRMNSDELQAYAKLMEERAKEATEFFKSESEHEGSDKEEEATETIEKPDVPGSEAEVESIQPEVAAEDLNEVEAAPVEAALTEAEAELLALAEAPPMEEAVSPTKAILVTEVVELPKLDLSTLNITPTSKPSTPRISEAIRRLKDEKSTDVSPSLKGDPNMVIDLETGDMFAKKPTGVDDLLQRLMKTREAKKQKTTKTVNILSTSHGKLELSKVSIHRHEEEPVIKEQKPGAAYLKMKDQLKALITKKRMEEMRKKQDDAIDEEEDEEDEEMEVDEAEAEAEEYEPDAKPSKSDIVINDDEEIVDEQEAAEANAEPLAADEDDADVDIESEDEIAEENADESSSSESEKEDQTQTSKRKNRIIRAFEDDNSDEDDVDLLQTPKPSNRPALDPNQLTLSAQKLFDAEVQRSASDEENELLGLCSGRFTQSEMSSAAPTTGALISQIPITQATPSTQADELEALCSGTFETQQSSLPVPETNKILSSDEESAEQMEVEKPRQKKLTKKRQKKKAKLGFSDDEESDEEDEEEEEEEEQADCEVEEVPETFVDYDSEENEIVVQMTKKDRKIRAANFVDKEAELSESEWGSADEDEKNMDTYDIELGDEDQFDREKLRNELGQIHARKMLDQDIREVRKIQEMLFEDEEGAVRQRQFRWKNCENGLGFSLDDTRDPNANADANEGSGDEENEHLWRKIRYEREQLLLEKGLKGTTAGGASPLSPAVVNTTTKKLTIVTAKKTTVEAKKNSPFLISKSTISTEQRQQQRTVRGSFLVRDKETLSKLAGLTKGAAGDVDGAAGTVSVNSSKAKNFVFATLTEEEHENQKRKAADLLNSSNETGINFMKKPRLEPRREKCLIDQLL